MSYDIELNDPVTGKVIELDSPHHMRGGTYALGGTTEASLNVTYNYAKHFYRLLGDKGIRIIYGNAKAAIMQLIALAKLRPDGVWSGD